MYIPHLQAHWTCIFVFIGHWTCKFSVETSFVSLVHYCTFIPANNRRLTYKLHGYTVHQQYLTLFCYQLMHITLKTAELLRHSKLDKNAPTCFGLRRNHLQGAKLSAWLKIARLVNSICVKDVQGIVSAVAAYCDCNKGYVCNMWTKIQTNNFLCKPKHDGAFLSNLECFNNSAFFNVMCISW